MKQAEAWTLKRFEKSDGLAAILGPIINSIYALQSLGYTPDDPPVRGQIEALERLEIEEPDTLRVQPCKSPVWDTSLALTTLLASGMPADDPRLLRTGAWLLEREVREAGDWQVKNPDGPIGGWYFEYANEYYPDNDDTAEVLMGLSQLRFEEEQMEAVRVAAVRRGIEWLLSMQNEDGGWAAFDKGCDKEVLTYIPFADHNAMLDPSCADITGRTLEMLTSCGYSSEHPAVRRAVAFLRRSQEPDGTWYGRWGCNYIYGTWLALTGLMAVGENREEACYQRAGEWLLSCQNDDGGWGETLGSYDEPDLKGQGTSTAAQTAWAVMALLTLGHHDSEAVAHGIDFLLRTQQADGTWHDEPWTGTGFPRVFYLRYHLYATYFPLLALAQYRERMQYVGCNP